LWKSKIPLKINVWLWLIWHNAIATKDNLLKRKWVGNASCQFCHQNETISHIFFECAAAKYVWSIIAMAVGAPNRPGIFTQFSVGSLVWFLPAETCKLLVWSQFVGLFGNCEIELVLKKKSNLQMSYQF
jgi:hypothetical protein